jgi:hypothetical protein
MRLVASAKVRRSAAWPGFSALRTSGISAEFHITKLWRYSLSSFYSVPRFPSPGRFGRYEGILNNTSGSISKGGYTDELFHDYLISTKKLLLTEPANSRVWVSNISNDSFGGVREILKGWTPDARGVFTDDLNRARRELASSFEAKSSKMSPVASATDIIEVCGI